MINTGGSNSNENSTTLNLQGMSIYGPPAFDSSTYQSLQTLAAAQNPPDLYVGEQDIDLIDTNEGGGGITDNGNITGSPVLQGGPVELWGGLGPLRRTWSTVRSRTRFRPGPFQLTTPMTCSSRETKLRNCRRPGPYFGFLISQTVDSTTRSRITRSAGATSASSKIRTSYSYASGSGQFSGLNDPEVILQESNYSVVFEGRPGAISADGRELVLGAVRSAAGTYGNGNPTGSSLIVSILSGVNSNGSPNMSMAGEWFQVAQQVSFANGTLKLLMQDPLPAMPAGGYYVVEVTPGFVNNSYIGNTINTFGTTSTDIDFDSSLDFGTRIIGNDLIGGSVALSGTFGAAVAIGATSASTVASGTIPPDWTVLPNLGTLIEDNVIQDALGGIQIGTEHQMYYYNGPPYVKTVSTTGRVFVTATVTGNEFEWDQTFLNSWENTYYASDGNLLPVAGAPSESELLPTITVGSGWSPMAPGDQNPPRFPSTVGNADTLFQYDVPQFVDPTENVVDAQGNYSVVISNGAVTPQTEPTGQVYDGIVNGSVVESSLVSEKNNNNNASYYGQTYYPLNVNTGLPGNPDSGNQLNINDMPSGTQNIQALMLGQDGYDLVGSGTGSPEPDGTQDLHIQLTGLSPTSSFSSLVVTDTVDNVQWVYGNLSLPQMVWQWGTAPRRPISSFSRQTAISMTPLRFNSRTKLAARLRFPCKASTSIHCWPSYPRFRKLPRTWE